MIDIDKLFEGLDLGDHSETPTVDETMTKEDLIARLQQFPDAIEDGLDLSNLFSMHNLIEEHSVYKDFIDVESIPEPYCDEEEAWA